jgi:hypothetical protein
VCRKKRKKGEEKKKQNTEVEVTSLEVFDSSKSVDIFNLLSKHLYSVDTQKKNRK